MTPNTRRAALFLVVGSIFFSAGCETRDTGPSRESFLGGMRDQSAADKRSEPDKQRPTASTPRRTQEQPSASRSPDAPRPSAPPVSRGPAIPDTRVMLYQPKGDLLLILVNESHSGRATEEGRTNLALGEANRAYKVLSDAGMTALLQSLAAAQYDASAEEFVKGDEQYLGKASGDLPRYQGIISVERGAGKSKVLGFRKSSESDALGAKRYQTYVNLKTLVQRWFSETSRDEYPVGGVSVPAPKGGK